MTSELQQLLDALGKRLQRNVTVDDSRLRQLAFSSHEYPAIDQLREDSIFKRDVPAEVAEWTFAAGARSAERPFRPPVNPAIGATTPRLCVPVRQQGVLLGFVWILEGDQQLTRAELQTVLDSLEAIAVVMQRDQMANELDRSRARELLRDLVNQDSASYERAAAELVDSELFVTGEPVAVAVVTLRPDGRALAEVERNVLVGWLERMCGRLSDRRHIALVRRDHGMLLLSERDPMMSGQAKGGFFDELVRNLARDLPDAAPVVGIGEVAHQLTDARLSYRQAERTARVARIVGGVGPVTTFESLGVYGLLARIPPEELTMDVLPPGLRRLLDAGTKGEQLAATLEAFLDNAGDAQLTADQMFVHRTTLYYRLQRIEEITGAQLGSGEDRLDYHLGLKIARLVGLRPAR